MKALLDLKQLVFKGELTDEVVFEGKKFVLQTLSIQDELQVYKDAGFDHNPDTEIDFLIQGPLVLKYAVKSIDGEEFGSPADRDEFHKILTESRNSTLFSVLWAGYAKLQLRRNTAGTELKNSSTTPNQSSTGA